MPTTTRRSRKRVEPRGKPGATADEFMAVLLEKGLDQALARFGLQRDTTSVRFHVGQLKMARHALGQHRAIIETFEQQEALHLQALQEMLDGRPGLDPDNPANTEKYREIWREEKVEQPERLYPEAAVQKIAHLVRPR